MAPKRIIENRVSITMPLARKKELDHLAGAPGYGREAGSIAAQLFGASWDMFRAFEFDAKQVHRFVAEHFPREGKRGNVVG